MGLLSRLERYREQKLANRYDPEDLTWLKGLESARVKYFTGERRSWVNLGDERETWEILGKEKNIKGRRYSDTLRCEGDMTFFRVTPKGFSAHININGTTYLADPSDLAFSGPGDTISPHVRRAILKMITILQATLES